MQIPWPSHGDEAPSPSKAPAAQEDEDLMGCDNHQLLATCEPFPRNGKTQKWVVYPWKSHENLVGGFNQPL